MAVEFDKLSDDRIRELAANPCPEFELEQMNSYELDVLNERIDKIAHEFDEDEKLFSELMRLKSQATLVWEFSRKRDNEYR